MPMLVVITYRDIELSRQHPLSGTLGELARQPGFQRLRLTGLSREETGRMMGLAGGSAVPSALVDAIHSQTEGNPLFVGEMTRLLIQEGVLGAPQRGAPPPARARAPQRIPEGIKEVIGRRLNRLSPRDQPGAHRRGHGRPRVRRAIAGRTDGGAGRRCLRGRARGSLAGARHRVPARGRPLPLRPRAVSRNAVRRDRAAAAQPLAPEGGAGAGAGAGDDIARQLPALAYHYWAALPGGDAARAIDYARRGGRTGRQRVRPRGGGALLPARAAGGESGADIDAALLRCQLLNALGEAHTRAGEYLLAQESFEQARAARAGGRMRRRTGARGPRLRDTRPGAPACRAWRRPACCAKRSMPPAPATWR